MNAELTPAHFALGEVRFKKQFHTLEADAANLVPVEQYVELDEAAREGKTHFIYSTDAGKRFVKVAVSSNIVELVEERRKNWNLLQYLDGQHVSRMSVESRAGIAALQAQVRESVKQRDFSLDSFARAMSELAASSKAPPAGSNLTPVVALESAPGFRACASSLAARAGRLFGSSRPCSARRSGCFSSSTDVRWANSISSAARCPQPALVAKPRRPTGWRPCTRRPRGWCERFRVESGSAPVTGASPAGPASSTRARAAGTRVGARRACRVRSPSPPDNRRNRPQYYAPIPERDFRRYAEQLPAGFPCCAKAPAVVTSPMLPGASRGAGPLANPDLWIATKTRGRTCQVAMAHLEESLAALQTDHVDEWRMHNIWSMEELDKLMAPGGAMEAALRAREQGKVRYISMSGHRNPQVQVEALKRFPFDSVLVALCALDHFILSFAEECLSFASERGIAVAGMKVLGLGALSHLYEKALRYSF